MSFCSHTVVYVDMSTVPVIMMTRMPACLHIRTAPSTSFLGGSNMPTQPTKVRSDCGEGRDGARHKGLV